MTEPTTPSEPRTPNAMRPEPRQLRLAAERLRQVAKASRLAVDKVPGVALLIGGDDADLHCVAKWLEEQAQEPVA